MTAIGRCLLAERPPVTSIPGLSSERRRELLNATGLGRRILAEEARQCPILASQYR